MKFFYQWLHRRFKPFHTHLTDPSLSIFLLSVGYHLALYLSTSNTTLLLLTAVYGALVYRATRSVGQTLLLVFLTTLPFAKGKGAQILLVPRELIPHYAWFKISYFFPLYLSDFVLFLSVCWYFRRWMLAKKPLLPSFSKGLRVTLAMHLAFTAFAALHVALSPHREVVFLSVLQLLKMLPVLALPFLLGLRPSRVTIQNLLSVITSSVLFQAGWALWQVVSGGPLGRHIEATLPGFEGGIVASEVGDLLRVNGTFYEPSILGTFLIMGLLILLAAKKNTFVPSKRLNAWMMAAITGGVFVLIFTGSRALYGMALLFVGALFRETLRWQNIRDFGAKYFLWIVGAGILSGNYLVTRLTTLTDIFSQYGTASYRLAMMGYALRIGLAAPLGIGLNLSPWFLATGFLGEQYVFDPTYPHNIFAQLFIEVGIIGLILFALFCFLALKNIRKDSLFFFPVAAFLGAAQLYPIFLNHPEILSFLYVFIGLGFWSQNRDSAPKRQQ